MPLWKPVAGSDAPRPIKSEQDEQRYTPTPRRIPLAVPLVGIFDEPYRCIIVNKEWWSHVSGMIDVLSSPELWLGTEDDKVRALREIAALLAYNDCGGFDMTPEELKIAVCEALDCWTENTALKIVSGVTSGIVVDEDGNVTVGGSGEDAVELPPDDPATPQIDESLAARAGGCQNVRIIINQLLGDMAAWHFGAATEEQVKQRLILIYGLEAGANLDAFVTYYYTVDATPDTVIVCSASLDSTFFCRGLTSESYAYYSLKTHLTSTDRETLLMLAPLLSQSLLNAWYESGIDTPSSLYLDYTCVKSPSETLLVPSMITGFNGQNVWKINHRLKITSSGHWVDVAGDIKDSWWYKAPSGSPIYQGAAYTLSVGGVGVAKPTTNQVPYRTDHIYTYTVDVGTAGTLGITIPSTSMDSPVTGSGLSLLIEDLGEIGL